MSSQRKQFFIMAVVAMSQSIFSSLQADDLVIAEFEGPTYGNWTVEGTAFGSGPAQGTLPGQMPVTGFRGKGLVNSFLQGDNSVGTLTSPEFKLERRYIRFLIGGGGWEGKTCVNLLVDGKVVRTATGPNSVSGGSEELTLSGWDVMEFAGKTARIQIVDHATGGWGHINLDDIAQTDQQPPILQRDVTRDIKAEQRYLNFPIKNNGPKRRVTLTIGGVVQPALDMELADGDPDWFAPLEISGHRGQSIQVMVDRLPHGSKALEQIRQSDKLITSAPVYQESLRPQLHFSPRRGWNNDPNGLVFFEGTYHLFFQHNPYGWNWGNMHWGHAISHDLVHWTEESETLYPDRQGPMFSGSAVVDWKNTSGFGQNGVPPIVLFYTAAGNPTVQSLAYSTDGGKSFKKYDHNPILPQITPGNRDPKVIFHQPTQRWVMVLYVEVSSPPDAANKTTPVHSIQFFTSTNLKEWKKTSQIDGFFECPDLFPLNVAGDPAQSKWVLTAASSEYMVGSFDGQTFTPETPKLPGHRGRGFYAAQTYSDVPDLRRIQIGWLQAESPGMAFNQAMSLPLDLKLVPTADGPRLSWHPVPELKSLRKQTHEMSKMTFEPGTANPLEGVRGELLELEFEFKPAPGSQVKFNVRGVPIVYNTDMQELTINGHRAAAPLRNGTQRITVYTDRTAFELFASDGLTYVPFPVIPKPGDLGVSIAVEGGSVEFSKLTAHELKSIWQPTDAK